MLKFIFSIFIISYCSLAMSLSIEDVLLQSNVKKFENDKISEKENQKILNAWNIIAHHNISLKIFQNFQGFEAFQGKDIYVGEAMNLLSEEEIVFALLHEISHIELKHWIHMVSLYQKYYSEDINEETVKIKIPGKEFSNMFRNHEFEADELAYQKMKKLGYSIEAIEKILLRFPTTDTATHPSSHKRILRIRMLEQP